ncbi:hypothetical protein ES288_A13G196800v1 [Gossypium darwinii]|uniref:Uncharacterized protein n=1 Tax=Gossypium darwinii TaxID=34276 RepID=A0A5D2E2G0_GOSDA|nr:hypothetical protein ES288_A13G196800v1 [Gossypium darwinii]
MGPAPNETPFASRVLTLLWEAAHEGHRRFCASASDAEPRGKPRYVRECIADVAWWSSARRGGGARRAVPGDCPGLQRLKVGC